MESSNAQGHAGGNVEHLGIDASEEAISNGSVTCLIDASHPSHGVAQVAIHSQVASRGTGAVNVHDAYMVLY
jgi:hypothetical protein